MKKAYILIVFSLILIFTGCGKNVSDQFTPVIDYDKTGQVKDIPQEDYEKPLTREWIKETYKYTDEELDDYYVDEMINSGEWSIGRMEEETRNSSEFYSLLRSNKVMYMQTHSDEIEAANAEKEKLYSRAYLMEGTAIDGEIPDSSELKWVFCQRKLCVNQGGDDNSPDGYVGFMIDFENKKYYLCKMYNENEFPHDYSLGEEIDLTDNQMTQIYEWFDEAKIESWDKTQDSDQELWHMGFQYKDGTIVTYTILEDDGKAPLSVLKSNLWNIVDSGSR